MAVYAVGDVQGCYAALSCVLRQVDFAAGRDQLWLVGDVVNRGPQSLEVLRFVRSLGASAQLVLGNHEMHLLAVAAGVRQPHSGDTLAAVLAAPDRSELLAWLAQQPLLHVDQALGYCMVHAGIPPQWELAQALQLAEEARGWLQPPRLASLAGAGDVEPDKLTEALSPVLRARVILSYFTRMRVCTADGRLDSSFKGAVADCPAGFLPWFAHAERKTRDQRVIFGHWAALGGRADAPNVFALDTGCAWGGSLTLMRLGDEQRFSCACSGVTSGG
ncbi:MAG: symmetrical bis(5'-nucleosyl)-tetraphosphatase [Deltaproteobacteria bacterium]